MKNTIDVKNILDNELHRIFHSEADFQHALSWELHKQYCEDTDRQIRLERPKLIPVNINSKNRKEINAKNQKERIYIDILIRGNHEIIPIELKYKTAKLKIDEFDLKEHSSHDTSRYDYVKDIERIEKVLSGQNGYGFAIFLTNDSRYWKKPGQGRTPQDEQFRIHEGQTLQGKLKWEGAKESTVGKKRCHNIELENTYNLNWRRYTYNNTCKNKPNGEFRYLAVKIK
ncbi:MAG: hypothetical protein R6U10_05210 [Thermoplasmatota archaeon]